MMQADKLMTTCKSCGYEINGLPEDYAPVCTPVQDGIQCNECIQCLLYCACNPQEIREKRWKQFTNLIEECQTNIEELRGEYEIALDSRRDLEQEWYWGVNVE